MGRGQEIFLMIFLITSAFFLFLSFQSAPYLLNDDDGGGDASLNAAEASDIHGGEVLYFKEEDDDGRTQNHVAIERVSGKEDEKDENGREAVMVDKFRALLGLTVERFGTKKSTEYFPFSSSPSPSPNESKSPSPSPSPAPSVHYTFPRSHTSPHKRTKPQPNTLHKGNNGTNSVKRTLVAVLVPAVVVFLACVGGLIWFLRKFSKSRRSRNAKSFLMHGKRGGIRGRSKYASSAQSSMSKVSFNPGLDLFYLESLGIDLEQQSLKQTCESVTSLSMHSTYQTKLECEAQSEQLAKSELDNFSSSSSTREIVSVHEDQDEEIVKYDLDGGNSPFSGNEIIPLDNHSSDDESFHSLGDSHSPKARVSNASAHSVGNRPEILSRNLSSMKIISTANSTHSPQSQSPCSTRKHSVGYVGTLECETLLTTQGPSFSPPPPPPLPPPPSLLPRLRISSQSSYSSGSAHKSSPFSTFKDLSSSRNSDSPSGFAQSPKSELSQSPRPYPKPAQSPSGIPPPPSPPPFLKGSAKSTRGPPPPPPSQLPDFESLSKDGGTLPKLKPLHWDKVRATPDRCMVWDKIRSSSFELDEEMIESLFGYNMQNPSKNDETKSRTPSPSKHVLEPKRLQNITILFKALNASPEQVCEALLQGHGLTQQQLEALVKMVPTKEEEAKLNSYKGGINELGLAERFLTFLLSIPFAFQRAEVMLYKETFEDEIIHLRNSFSMLEEACKELRSSRLFLKLLEAVLKTGNRMNVGTIRGGAKAFKLDALLKLADVKGTDGKTTLLHFVVQEMVRSEGIRVSDSIMGKIDLKSKNRTAEEKEENYRRMGLDLVAGLSTELYNVKRTATIDLDVLASSVSNLSDGMAKLRKLVCKDLSTDEEGEKFGQSMRSFITHSEKRLKELQEDEDRVLLHVRGITEYFHGDVSKEEANPLRIFVIVRDFMGMLDHVCKELRCSKVPSSPTPLAPFR